MIWDRWQAWYAATAIVAYPGTTRNVPERREMATSKYMLLNIWPPILPERIKRNHYNK
jgi:hypothetical protein